MAWPGRCCAPATVQLHRCLHMHASAHTQPMHPPASSNLHSRILRTTLSVCMCTLATGAHRSHDGSRQLSAELARLSERSTTAAAAPAAVTTAATPANRMCTKTCGIRCCAGLSARPLARASPPVQCGCTRPLPSRIHAILCILISRRTHVERSCLAHTPYHIPQAIAQPSAVGPRPSHARAQVARINKNKNKKLWPCGAHWRRRWRRLTTRRMHVRKQPRHARTAAQQPPLEATCACILTAQAATRVPMRRTHGVSLGATSVTHITEAHPFRA